ncbi:hypothetical protein D3C71_318370 [compost metagenome]
MAKRESIEVTLPYMGAVGTAGAVHLIHNRQCGDKAHLSISVGHAINGSSADAPLSIDSLHQLVDGLMDCIYALEHQARLGTES